MESFCRELPKVELHAHLNGSLRPDTLDRLLALHRRKWSGEALPARSELALPTGGGRAGGSPTGGARAGGSPTGGGRAGGSLDDPFAMFPLIQSVTDNPEAVALATRDVIRDFAEENVRYLELRSTPRSIPGRMTTEEYVASIADEILKANADADLPIEVKLLLAIDRRASLEAAEDTLQLCLRMKRRYPTVLVGLDLSGDPRVGDATTFLPLLRRARAEHGLKLALHLAEVDDKHDETLALLQFAPDRVGHGVAIHPSTGGSERLLGALKAAQAPVEVCLTSNRATNAITSVKDSHLRHFLECSIPCCLCTDDAGVFGCSLSDEYRCAADELGLSRRQLFQMSFDAIGFAFAGDDVKARLRAQWMQWRETNLERE